MDSEVTHENSSSFMDVTGDGSVISSAVESSNLTTIGSEPAESVTTTVRSSSERRIKTQVEEHCSTCLKREKITAASHFCKECKPYGKYLCHICLKDHNVWLRHKQIYSLSDWKR